MLELLAKGAMGSEPGFGTKYVRWAIVFDSRTGFRGMVELGQPEMKKNRGREFNNCPDLTQPELVSGSSPRSHFLVETASVVAKYTVDEKDTKTPLKHRFFLNMLTEAGKNIQQLRTIAHFMRREDVLHEVRQAMAESKVKPSDKVTFQLDGEFPLEKEYWYEWWRNFRRSLIGAEEQPAKPSQFRCFVSGDLVIPAATHPKIRGLAGVGGLTTGDVLVGFDKEAFCSYGLEQSANAAVSEKAAKAYTDGLNKLIGDSGVKLAGTMVVHWFKNRVKYEDDPVAFLTETPEIQELNAREGARKLLRSLETGQRPDLASNRYYILTLSGAAGRTMVRDWVEGEFEELVRNINKWFDDLEMVWHDGARIAFPPRFISVLQALSRDLNELPTPLVSKLWRVAVRGEEIPYQVLFRSVHRRKVEVLQNEEPNVNGMALIRAYHLRKYRKEANELAEKLTPKLNKDFPHIAYQCGRLMAALAQLQQAALGNVGAGVVQRYFAAASTTPALVLGRLTSNSQHHLNKLDAGLAHWYQDKIAEIWSHISGPLPKTLTLEEQSLFALGYYHELASFRASKSENESKEKEE